MEDVRHLTLRYSHARPDKVDLSVEYVGGRIKVFEVDRYLIERLLEQLETEAMHVNTESTQTHDCSEQEGAGG